MSSSTMVTTAIKANDNKVAPPQLPLELLTFDSALESLAKWFPPRSADVDWWWQVMGSHLQTMLSAAGYTISEQSEALLFFYHWVAPRMGPKPNSAEAEWKSFMTDDFSPVEYSWKWGFGDDAPEIRYSVEPIGHFAGTTRDPLNQQATCEFITQLQRSGLRGLNTEWFEHFKHALLGPGTPASKVTEEGRSTLFMAFEHGDGPTGVKAYYVPVDAPGNSSSSQISRAIASAGCPNLTAINNLNNFLQTDVHGRSINPFMLGIDCVVPAESRLKIYARSPVTTFESVRHVMSFGGQRTGLEEVEKQLHELWNAVLGLPADFPTDKPLDQVSHETAGVLFYFDVAPKSALPDVKVYIPVHHYAPSDEVTTNGLCKFLNDHNRGAYTDQYRGMLNEVATKEGMSKSNGVHTWVTCAYKKGKLVVTSYLNPQYYHASRF